jgi:hypothetical protein
MRSQWGRRRPTQRMMTLGQVGDRDGLEVSQTPEDQGGQRTGLAPAISPLCGLFASPNALSASQRRQNLNQARQTRKR